MNPESYDVIPTFSQNDCLGIVITTLVYVEIPKSSGPKQISHVSKKKIVRRESQCQFRWESWAKLGMTSDAHQHAM